MSGRPSDLGSYLSLYESFVSMLAIFLGFILATIALVSFLTAPLESRRLTLWFLLTSFAIMDFSLVRIHSRILEKFASAGCELLCPPYNDELLTIAMTLMSLSIGFMLLIGGLTICESVIWWVISGLLACYSFTKISKAKKSKPNSKATII
jgi:hypothetical protein